MLYEGTRCPRCKKGFDPAVVRVIDKERLIVVDVDPPVYEPTPRCRCPQCKNLFALTESEFVARVQCQHCLEPLFSRTQLQNLWRADDSLLLRARHLDQACRALQTCPHCGEKLEIEGWCPLCRRGNKPPQESCLPGRTGEIWVRT